MRDRIDSETDFKKLIFLSLVGIKSSANIGELFIPFQIDGRDCCPSQLVDFEQRSTRHLFWLKRRWIIGHGDWGSSLRRVSIKCGRGPWTVDRLKCGLFPVDFCRWVHFIVSSQVHFAWLKSGPIIKWKKN